MNAAILLMAGLLTAATPTPLPAPTPSPRLLEGRWGGRGVGLQVSAEGVQLDFDCAHATIRPPLSVGETGRFRLQGTYFQERPGPSRQGREDSAPALYEGSTDGNTMSLTISLPDSGRSLGPYTLTLGAPPRVRKCQ